MKNKDKFNCQVIKELIKDEKISLAALTRDELEQLIAGGSPQTGAMESFIKNARL